MPRYAINPMFHSRVSMLGDVSQFPIQPVSGDTQHVNIDTADVFNLGDNLRAAQGRLSTLTQALLQNPSLRTPDIANALNSQQAELADLTTKYVGAYTAVFGQPPAGLGNPLLIGAAVAVLLAYIASNLYLWYQKQQVLETQAQAQVLTEQNRQALLNAAAQKQQEAQNKSAAGDAAGAADAQAAANALYQEAGTPGTTPAPPGPQPPTTDLATWLKENWIVAAVVVGGIFVLPKVLGR